MYTATSYPVAVGTPTVVDALGMPTTVTVTAIPGASGTLAVETSTTPTAVSNPGAATWRAWPAGTVSVGTSDILDGPVRAIRATATTAAGVLEVVT